MHLKSLALKGFKSFASPTTLRFEPGITCVVGPNGSGKSNVVDAIAWVLGEQGAKALRGGKMEDVVFAGTPGRAPLGRAEVTLTIDNSDGALPVEFAEVSVRRRMFRSGESEYAVNGDRCRLVDVQELMSDSGIGRELHVVVGQGQLDTVLGARPEERRAFVEEAAGVLKHRKRKERALRKLEAMQANLTRLSDLGAELNRQLKPLGRQAETARRALTVQAELRDARLRLLADDLVQQRAALAAEERDEDAARGRRTELEAELAAARAEETALEAAGAEQQAGSARAADTWYCLSALQERLRGSADLAAQRLRHLQAPLPAPERAGRDPEALEREAAGVREQERELARRLAEDVQRLSEASAGRAEREAALAAEERALAAAVRAAADRREGLARLTGQVAALRSRAGTAETELDRLAGELDETSRRAGSAAAGLAELQEQAARLEAGEVELDERHERAEEVLAGAQRRLTRLQDEEREVERERSTWTARRDALALSLDRRDGAGELLAADLPGVLGAVAGLLQVEPGAEAALAAALGAAADAVAVADLAAAATAVRHLRAEDAGRAGLLVGGGVPAVPAASPPLPDGACWALGLLRAPDVLEPALRELLAGTAVVPTLEQARALAETGLRVATSEGDLLGPAWAAGGSAAAPSLLEVQAAVEEATARAADAAARAERLVFDRARARAEVQQARVEVEDALSALNDSDAAMAALAEQLAARALAVRTAEADTARLEQARARAEQARDRDRAALAELEQRLSAAQAAPDGVEPSPRARDALATDAAAARTAEVEARLGVRTGEERVRALAGRAEQLERAARSERAARERLAQVAARRSAAAGVAQDVLTAAREALEAAAASVAAAGAQREQAAARSSQTAQRAAALRTSTRQLAERLEELTDDLHRREVARTQARLHLSALESRAQDEESVPLDRLLAEYGPDVPVPGGNEDAEPVPYDRAVQEARRAEAERALARLGKVNPLALEEFTALQERSAFLAGQLQDLHATRRDLLTVVDEVDERVRDVFAAAYEDTAREFGRVFATLFPGGEGRLVLTDPGDLLTTGIEVHARPAGKRVSRLSLLSGGERSLTALALLVAIFRARPSPFYVLDEVEAALDDRNLGRLLELLGQLRGSSQLIVITHQRRTMEIADALYGVTMRGDGVSAVVSQRLREPLSA